VAELLSRYAGQNALAEARSIAATPEALKSYHSGKFGSLLQEFREDELALLTAEGIIGTRPAGT